MGRGVSVLVGFLTFLKMLAFLRIPSISISSLLVLWYVSRCATSSGRLLNMSLQKPHLQLFPECLLILCTALAVCERSLTLHAEHL